MNLIFLLLTLLPNQPGSWGERVKGGREGGEVRVNIKVKKFERERHGVNNEPR